MFTRSAGFGQIHSRLWSWHQQRGPWRLRWWWTLTMMMTMMIITPHSSTEEVSSPQNSLNARPLAAADKSSCYSTWSPVWEQLSLVTWLVIVGCTVIVGCYLRLLYSPSKKNRKCISPVSRLWRKDCTVAAIHPIPHISIHIIQYFPPDGPWWNRSAFSSRLRATFCATDSGEARIVFC